MSIPKIIGAAMVASVIIGIFVAVAIKIGVFNALLVCGAAIAMSAFLAIGITLLTDG